ncbi:glycosyltransferase [Phormidium tenue FACHB-886]|nr:glycosyltransferase [Phormidium tenue FACHB-886]
MHVAVYTDAAGVGGAEISLGHLIATVSREIQLTVIGVVPDVVEAITRNRPQVDRLILPPSGFRSFLAHVQTFRRLRPQVLHFNCCTPWANATGLTAALFCPGVRIVRVDQLPLRTTDAATLWRTRALCLRTDAHVAVGEASARRMEDFYALGRDSVVSIPNGVPDVAPPSLPPAQVPMVVGSIGRLDAMKAHDILLRAVAQVEGVKAVILGEGDRRSALEQLATELGIRDRIHLPGWVENPRDHLPAFNVVALPSRSEGFPLAMVEAMLAARPVIATRVGSMPEAIVPGETGLLIDKNDVTGLANALRQLRDNPALRLQMGQKARSLALDYWTVESMTAAYEALWQKVRRQAPVNRLQVARPKD